MALREVLSQASLAAAVRLPGNDNLGLFGYIVPNLKPVKFDPRTRPALASFKRVVDLNDNDAIIVAGSRAVLAPRPVVPESHRITRPFVVIHQPPAEILHWPNQPQPRRRPRSSILWNLGLVCVAAAFLAVALPA